MSPRPFAEKLRRRVSSGAAPIRVNFYYGWVIVAIAALEMFFSGPGQSFGISVFVSAYIKDFHLDRTAVSALYSAATLIAGVFLFLLGRAIDARGHRALAVVVALLFAVSCAFSSIASGVVMLFISFLGLRFFGQGGMQLISMTLVPQWFVRQRGRAMSMIFVGSILGVAAIPPLNYWMLSTWGWPVAWRVWAAALIVIFVPLAAVFLRGRPEHVGLRPDGDSVGNRSEDAAIPEDEESWTLNQAMSLRTFWFVLFCNAVPPLVNTGIVFQLFSILGEDHIPAQTAAFTLSIFGVVSFVATLLAGYFVDKFKTHHVISAAFVLMLAQMWLLVTAHSLGLALLFVIAWGLSQGSLNIAFNTLYPTYFGRRHLGSISGLMMTAGVIASAISPVVFGFAFDHFGGYHQILLVMMIFPVLAAILAFFSPKPQRELGSTTGTA